MTRARPIVRMAPLLLALGLGSTHLGGCKKKNESKTTTAPSTDDQGSKGSDGGDGNGSTTPAAPTLTIRIQAEDDGNAGRPLYAVVRAVTLKDFVEDQYQDIAALVVEPDETVLASFVVFPGRSREVTVAKPEGTVGVYGLFTAATGTSWKRLYDAPDVIEVVAGKDRLLEAE